MRKEGAQNPRTTARLKDLSGPLRGGSAQASRFPGSSAHTGPRALTRVLGSAKPAPAPPPGLAVRPPAGIWQNPASDRPAGPRTGAGRKPLAVRRLGPPGAAALDRRAGETRVRPAPAPAGHGPPQLRGAERRVATRACALALAPPARPRSARGLHGNRPAAGSREGSAFGPGEPGGSTTLQLFAESRVCIPSECPPRPAPPTLLSSLWASDRDRGGRGARCRGCANWPFYVLPSCWERVALTPLGSSNKSYSSWQDPSSATVSGFQKFPETSCFHSSRLQPPRSLGIMLTFPC